MMHVDARNEGKWLLVSTIAVLDHSTHSDLPTDQVSQLTGVEVFHVVCVVLW